MFLFWIYRIHNGQFKPEHTALSFTRRFYADGAPMMLDYFTAQGQADAGALETAARL
jgi:hypothetical protein